MKLAVCAFDLFFPVIESILTSGHEICSAWTFECDNVYNFNRQCIALATKHRYPITVGPIRGVDLHLLQEQGVEALICAGYSYRVPVYEAPALRCVNVHGSLLPHGRGPWPQPWQILRFPEAAGVTLHEMTMRWDSGKTILRDPIIVSPTETLETLTCKVQLVARNLVLRMLSDFDSHWARAEPLDASAGSYWKKPTETERTLDWNASVEEIDRLVRSFGRFTTNASFDNREWIVRKASLWKENHSIPPGSVLLRNANDVLIAVKDGYCCLTDFEEWHD